MSGFLRHASNAQLAACHHRSLKGQGGLRLLPVAAVQKMFS